MPMTVTRRFFRYFALALAAIQLAAFAGAPVLEGTIEVAGTRNVVTADSNGPDRSVPAHDSSTCAVCQLISSVAPPPQPGTIPAPRDETTGRIVSAVDLPGQHFRRSGVLSRAPPTLPA